MEKKKALLVVVPAVLVIIGSLTLGRIVTLKCGESTMVGWTLVRCECDAPEPTSTPRPTSVPTATPQPTETPAVEPTHAPTRTPEASGKRGGAVPMNDYCPNEDATDIALVSASWWYNWGRAPHVDVPGFVPMLYSEFSGCPTLPAGEWVLGANEPDVAGQANLTPVEVAQMQRQMEACYPDKRIVSPACVNARYLKYVWAAYFDMYWDFPRWDAIAVHCYSGTAQCLDDVAWAVDKAGDWRADEVWVTEFIAPDVNQMAALKSAFEREPMVTRYAWFATRYAGTEPWALWYNTSLVGCEDGELTEFGETYRR